MSAILNALRKLEDDSGTLRPWSIRIRTVGNRRGKRIFFLLSALCLGLSGLAGYVYFESSRPSTDRVNSRSGAERTDRGSLLPEVKKQVPVSLAAVPQTPREDVSAAGPHPVVPPARKTEAALPKPASGQIAAQPNGDFAQPSAVKDRAPLQSMPLSNSAPPAAPLNAAPLNSDQQTASEWQFLPIFNDPTFSLQAIAWSEDPDERIAVLNGKVLREGDSAEGLTVMKIREDEVVVREGVRTMKIVFKGR